jgi:hypothetical protein
VNIGSTFLIHHLGLNKTEAEEIRQWARSDFEHYRNEKDLVWVTALLILTIIWPSNLFLTIGKDQVAHNVGKTTNA